ncbi:PLP-dependent aminotransferase family protein [Pseudomonas sp. 148P]|uniref:PLP-dependent aminotransferase family protein n=1 Tax=Pseudomonas ulcerans TaxID=3115852 RepID=A0ABU7HYU5_9PSED|nr:MULTISPECIES: PLP-dependent aminotransferase family protein [unclassified Pseudomonas]MEE1922843.1 PLP-dependent aminotransferase family protein [Pseudomonas sp. 147P]MEE1936743.1 PLP-dependent aminotransferase family protein [Pseudomonas sp. 148P]
MKLNLDRQSTTPLVQQLSDGLCQWISAQRLRPGTRLPSIRHLVREQGVSQSCAIEAYDRLVSQGWLEARHGVGFFVAERRGQASFAEEPAWGEGAEGRWRLFSDEQENLLRLGCGWLPANWRQSEEIALAIRQVSRGADQDLFGYGPPLGLTALRQQVRKRLALLGIHVQPEQILATQGASQALDLLVRTLLKPGDTVLVERPGYYNLYNLLRLHGVRMLEVPRTPQGPDLDVLATMLREHRPRYLFVNSLYQNPTGTSLSPRSAQRLLELAGEHDLRIIEDDIYADFQEGPATRLATLDSQQRVIYLASFSKTLSSSLRVGYLVADAGLVARLAEVKMVTGIGASRFAEQVVAQLLGSGVYRKSVQRLRVRLAEHMASALRLLEANGWEVFAEPYGGMFVWTRYPGANFSHLQALAQDAGVLLSPGSAFDPQGRDSDWLRINVAYARDVRAQAFFQAVRQASSWRPPAS